MRTEDFDFALPEDLIAQTPLPRRDASRLLAVARDGGAVQHLTFRSLPGLLRRGDLMVLNDTRVIPARLLGKKLPSGGRAELLLVRPVAQVRVDAALRGAVDALDWTCLGQASKGLKAGQALQFDAGLQAEVLEALGGGEYRVRFVSGAESLSMALAAAGRIPLPPYIHRAPDATDAERYQTVYARVAGSVAAPTAGLHFTPEVFADLEGRGVEKVFVTLDVGPGTFLPVREGEVGAHVMHRERCVVPTVTAERIRAVKRGGGSIVAVGTTVVRTLETFGDDAEVVRSGEADTGLFIAPGFRFRVIDAMVTNFHLPKSTLVMLVSAFLGRERTLAAYAEAVRERYRFFSYGDSMVIVPTRA